MSGMNKRIRNNPDTEKEGTAGMTPPQSEPTEKPTEIELQPLSQERTTPSQQAPKRVKKLPSKTCLYVIPLNLASCVIAVFDVLLGLAVGAYGYFALTEYRKVPKSDDLGMSKLTAIVYMLLAFMIVVFSTVMFVGVIFRRTDLVSPYIMVVGLMSGCTALMCFTTAVAVNVGKEEDENNSNIALYIYVGTTVTVVLQFFFIRAVNKFYKLLKEEQLAKKEEELAKQLAISPKTVKPKSKPSTNPAPSATPKQSTNPTQSSLST